MSITRDIITYNECKKMLQPKCAAVQALPFADRQIVGLYLEGLSAAEIEAITGISAGAVATRLTRIRQRLSSIIQKPVTTS